MADESVNADGRWNRRRRFDDELGDELTPPPYYMEPGDRATLHLEGGVRSSRPGPVGTVQPEGEPHTVFYEQWTVRMDRLGLGVTTSVPIAGQSEADEVARRARAVGDLYALAATVASHVPMRIDWERRYLVRLDGENHVVGDAARNYLEFVPVDAPPDESFAALCESAALAEAAVLFREALIAVDEERLGVDLFLGLAVEHLVAVVLPAQVADANTAATWTALASTVGTDAKEARRLYASLQLGRHRDASRQREWLAENGLPAMTAREKIDAVDALLATQLRRGRL